MFLTPLDTFPGWPHADNPSVIAMLLLFIGLPVAVAAVIAVLGMGGRWRRGTDDDTYAPDVRRSMALAGAPSDWAQIEAGRENDTAEEPLREGLPGHRPEDRMVAAGEGATAGATSVAKQESAHGDRPHEEPGSLRGADADQVVGTDAATDRTATTDTAAGHVAEGAAPTGATSAAPRRAADEA